MSARIMPPDEAAAIGRNVARLREARGLTAEGLGRLIDYTGVSHLERGHGCSLRTIRDIAVQLGVSYDQLLGVPGTGAAATKNDDWEQGRRAGLAEGLAAMRDLVHRSDPNAED
jgi:transcriptional regulator with XRE-family HTH domain